MSTSTLLAIASHLKTGSKTTTYSECYHFVHAVDHTTFMLITKFSGVPIVYNTQLQIAIFQMLHIHIVSTFYRDVNVAI